MKFIDNIEKLENIYGLPSEAALKKATHKITLSYKKWIEKSTILHYQLCWLTRH